VCHHARHRDGDVVNAVAQSCALIGALVYIEVFPLESFLLRRPSVQQFLSTPAANVPAVMMWAFNNGFRNLQLRCVRCVGRDNSPLNLRIKRGRADASWVV
jgi:Protein of unknown function (DUF1304)